MTPVGASGSPSTRPRPPARSLSRIRPGCSSTSATSSKRFPQRWNTYIVGYDLRTQIRIFDDVHRRYEALRTKTSGSSTTFGRWARSSKTLALLLILGVTAVYAWRQGRLRKHGARAEDEALPKDAAALAASSLYKQLEVVLSLRGIPRPLSLPPLRHAIDLTQRHHPLADEVLALTHLYLDTRFGHRTLSEADRHDFEQRVRGVRLRKLEPLSPPPEGTGRA